MSQNEIKNGVVEPGLVTRMRHVTNMTALCNSVDRKVYLHELLLSQGSEYAQIVMCLYSQSWQEKNGPREL